MSEEHHADNPDWTDEQARTEFVPGHQCIWCKGSLTDTTHDRLTTGERICENCIGDLREWKRTRFADMLVAPSLEDTIRTALLDDWQDLMDVMASIHAEDPKLKTLPSRTSNAHEHREHGDDSTGGERY